jgi:hypothetical protein
MLTSINLLAQVVSTAASSSLAASSSALVDMKGMRAKILQLMFHVYVHDKFSFAYVCYIVT